MRRTGVDYPQMRRSLRVVCQLLLVDGDCADCCRRRFHHLRCSLSPIGFALVVLVVLVLVILVVLLLALLCKAFPQVFGHIFGVINPTPSRMTFTAGGTGGISSRGLIKRLIKRLVGRLIGESVSFGFTFSFPATSSGVVGGGGSIARSRGLLRNM